jgi:hypothetical protein
MIRLRNHFLDDEIMAWSASCFKELESHTVCTLVAYIKTVQICAGYLLYGLYDVEE